MLSFLRRFKTSYQNKFFQQDGKLKIKDTISNWSRKSLIHGMIFYSPFLGSIYIEECRYFFLKGRDPKVLFIYTFFVRF